MSKIFVLGSINVDLVICGPRLPRPGETVLGVEFFQANGGKGANQAVAAARLSHNPVTFLAAVGDDSFGRDSLAALSQENLDCQFIKTDPNLATGVALIMVDAKGENCISVASGANLALTYKTIEVAIESCSPGDVVLACLESPLETVATAVRRAKQRGATTILNPAPADVRMMDDDLLDSIDVLTPNVVELQALTGFEDKARALDQTRQLPCDVIVTMGAEGCFISMDGETNVIPANHVEVVDTTAAGDAFSGALAVAISEGKSLRDAAVWANRAASISVTRLGAQPSLPHKDDLI